MNWILHQRGIAYTTTLGAALEAAKILVMAGEGEMSVHKLETLISDSALVDKPLWETQASLVMGLTFLGQLKKAGEEFSLVQK